MTPVLTVKFFRTDGGREPVRDWLRNGHSPEDRRSIGTDIKTVQFGWPIGMPVVRKMEADMWEIRSRIRDGIARTLFTVIGSDIGIASWVCEEKSENAKRRLTDGAGKT